MVPNKTEKEIITDVDQGQIQIKEVKDVINSLPNPGIHIDSVVHDVKMTINGKFFQEHLNLFYMTECIPLIKLYVLEYGTEAVAATIAFTTRRTEQFYADSPFYMFIRNERTKLVTFSAVIFDPTVTIE